MLRRLLLLSIICLARAQEPPLIRLDVRNVVVPVIVTDSKSHNVHGLTGDDFRVFDDKERQTLISATEIAGDGGPAGQSSGRVEDKGGTMHAPPEPGERPSVYVVCFDVLHTSPQSFARARTALVQTLRSRMARNPGSVILVSLGTRLQIMQTATADLNTFVKRLDSSEFASSLSSAERSGFYTELDSLKQQMEGYCKGCLCGRAATNTTRGGCDLRQQRIRGWIESHAEEYRQTGAAFLSGLKALLNEEGKFQGRASLILVSDGFALQPAKEFYAVASAYLPNSLYFNADQSFSLQPQLDEALRTAVHNDIAVYAVDSRGVYNPSFLPGGLSDASSAQMGTSSVSNRGGTLMAEMDSKSSQVAFENTSGLSQLAEGTGGEFLHSTNDLGHLFSDVFDDGRNYYLLTYAQPHVDVHGEFHTIQVQVEGRRGLKIRAKKGYWSD